MHHVSMLTLQETDTFYQDFHGQRLVDQISKVVLVAAAVSDLVGRVSVSYSSLVQIISFIVGFAMQSLQITFFLYGACIVVLALVCTISSSFHCSQLFDARS